MKSDKNVMSFDGFGLMVMKVVGCGAGEIFLCILLNIDKENSKTRRHKSLEYFVE